MAQLSRTSKLRRDSCHSDLRILIDRLILDYDFTVVCGHRGEEAQNKAWRERNSTKQWPNSRHNSYPSQAVDLAPYEKSGIDWGKLQSAYFAGRVMGLAEELFRQGVMKHRIRPGIDWDQDNDIDDTKFWDAGHFEIIPNE